MKGAGRYTCPVRRAAGSLVGALILAAVLLGCDTGESPSAPAAAAESGKAVLDEGGHPLLLPTDDPGTLAFETELLRLVNEHRVLLGLHALVEDVELGDAARAHSAHMIEHRFFSHVAPEGWEPGERLNRAGIAWEAMGENIGAGYATPEEAFHGWMSSPEHREAIESPEWTHTGVGYALDGAPGEEFPHAHYWTQIFVRR